MPEKPPEGRAPERPRRRADARRNAAAILEAALTCLLADPQAGVTAIARAAGVSRVTLYSHFPTRERLLEAVLEKSVAEALPVLEAEAEGDALPEEALARVIRSSWRILDRHSSLFAAVSAALTAEQVREHHERLFGPMLRLIGAGQQTGGIRADLRAEWLVTVVYHLMHAAATEVRAGRLASEAAPEVLTGTILAAVRPQPVGA